MIKVKKNVLIKKKTDYKKKMYDLLKIGTYYKTICQEYRKTVDKINSHKNDPTLKFQS